MNVYKAEDIIGEFEFGIVVNVVDLKEACGEEGYLVSVTAAKLPEYLSPELRSKVQNSIGDESEMTLEDIIGYGCSVDMDSYHVITEEEKDKKVEELESKLDMYGGLCGFFFDKPQNRIGKTGWDFLNGNVI